MRPSLQGKGGLGWLAGRGEGQALELCPRLLLHLLPGWPSNLQSPRPAAARTGGTMGVLAATRLWACWRRKPTIWSAVMPASRAATAESRVMVPTNRLGSSASQRTNTRRMAACTADVV